MLRVLVASAATVAWLAAAPVQAGFRDTFIDPDDGSFDASRYLSERSLGFLPVPVIITEPAVGGGAGLVAMFFHESAAQKRERLDSAETRLPADISLVGGAATENGTWGAAVGHLGFWREDRIRYRGFAGYGSINLDFYSLGGVELPRAVELKVEGPAVFNELKVRVGSGRVFLGARQLFRRVDTSLARDAEANRLPPPGEDAVLDRL